MAATCFKFLFSIHPHWVLQNDSQQINIFLPQTPPTCPRRLSFWFPHILCLFTPMYFFFHSSAFHTLTSSFQLFSSAVLRSSLIPPFLIPHVFPNSKAFQFYLHIIFRIRPFLKLLLSLCTKPLSFLPGTAIAILVFSHQGSHSNFVRNVSQITSLLHL